MGLQSGFVKHREGGWIAFSWEGFEKSQQRVRRDWRDALCCRLLWPVGVCEFVLNQNVLKSETLQHHRHKGQRPRRRKQRSFAAAAKHRGTADLLRVSS